MHDVEGERMRLGLKAVFFVKLCRQRLAVRIWRLQAWPSRSSTLLSGESTTGFAKGGMRGNHFHHMRDEKLDVGWDHQ